MYAYINITATYISAFKLNNLIGCDKCHMGSWSSCDWSLYINTFILSSYVDFHHLIHYPE